MARLISLVLRLNFQWIPLCFNKLVTSHQRTHSSRNYLPTSRHGWSWRESRVLIRKISLEWSRPLLIRDSTDNTVRIVKMTNIDGEYMAIGRMTTETSNVLSPFGQDVNVTGSSIQEIEFNHGFRMSLKATQQMTVNTNVVNGVSTTMTAAVGAPISEYQ